MILKFVPNIREIFCVQRPFFTHNPLKITGEAVNSLIFKKSRMTKSAMQSDN
ncbi:protein of unknown function [Vibrio tapetis subsp. tapetis]|uniref:Uncharacterized protein n=1 Tax=Vibrio tapetis subsp. tapetis TaxID=1671868 RepID=A0A2N8ZAR4_9VIBR|nr:protein of unknown function [Vibrio tapetis subsp. tapetis]